MNQKHTVRDVQRAIGRDVEWLTLGQTATYLGVAESTVRKWAAEGRVPAYSTPGGHRRFRASDLETFLEQSRVDHPDDGGQRVVLIVDDDERTRAVVRFALEQDGYAVAEAASPSEGLEAVDENAPDLILLNVLMEQFNGFEMLCRLRDSHGLETVPVLMFASDPSAPPRASRKGGVKGFVGTGASPGALVDAAKRLLGAPVRTSAR